MERSRDFPVPGPQRQRRDPIPAWAIGPGYRHTNPRSPVGARHSRNNKRPDLFARSGGVEGRYDDAGRWNHEGHESARMAQEQADQNLREIREIRGSSRTTKAQTSSHRPIPTPERQRRDPIPAWAIGPGYRHTNSRSPVGARHSGNNKRPDLSRVFPEWWGRGPIR